MRKVAVRCSWGLPTAWMAVTVAASAAQLPVRTYTTADGLARNTVECIVQDPREFLWFCTSEGLSRFDGYTFTNYGIDHGLPNRAVTSLLVSRRGVYWVGTWAGLFRFDPNSSPPQKFEAVPLGVGGSALLVYSLAEDRSGSLWAGTNSGLYRLESGEAAWVAVDAAVLPGGSTRVQVLFVDRRGALWIGVEGGVQIRWPDGRMTSYRDGRLRHGSFAALCDDREGRIWASDHKALYRLSPGAGPRDPIVSRTYTIKDGLPGNRIEALMESSDGRFWAGGGGGLGLYIPATDTFESYTTAQGLSDPGVKSLAEDKEGNLWVGAEAAGVMKIAHSGFTSYTRADGLSNMRIAALFLDRAGEVCVSNNVNGSIDCFDGRRFRSNLPNYPHNIQYFGWGSHQHVLQDHEGEWWIPTGQGLCRFGRTSHAAQLAGRSPKAVYTTRDGLGGNDIFRLFEDSRGDIWIVTLDSAALNRWERATGSIHRLRGADGLPDDDNPPVAFAEDRSGQVWVGLYRGGLARFRNGHFTLYTGADGVPAGMIGLLHLDHAGRLWIGSDRGGLGRIDNPSAANPRIARYTTSAGLSSNAVQCLTEDQWGRIYAGTVQGLDRLDPNSGRIRHYTSADGLARGEPHLAERDRDGALWFGSLLGLSRLEPEIEKPAAPPPVHIIGLQVHGVAQPLAEFGQTAVSGLVLQPNQNQLRLDFVGLGFAPGERLRYQYRLEGAERDWSPPTAQRTINYASLRPGGYTFEVRAVNAEGAVSPRPASVTFQVLAPVWQRWWFLAAASIALSLLIHSFYRYRLSQLLAVERIRTRIATDLHDDVGSSLSQVAILSEVVRRRIGESDPEINAPLSRIGVISRELVDSMSDIVWSINPAKDNLYFLTQRMREFANEAFMTRDIPLEFCALESDHEICIGAEVRRQVFLIFKESIHNVIRHANCSHVEIAIRVGGGRLVLQVRDNGLGFDTLSGVNGNGLASMRDRARRLGGTLDVTADGQSTSVTLEVPLAKTSASRPARSRPA
jgi:ligand-binding sensor domain-containing protein/signal transduction histidine kinase